MNQLPSGESSPPAEILVAVEFPRASGRASIALDVV